MPPLPKGEARHHRGQMLLNLGLPLAPPLGELAKPKALTERVRHLPLQLIPAPNNLPAADGILRRRIRGEELVLDGPCKGLLDRGSIGREKSSGGRGPGGFPQQQGQLSSVVGDGRTDYTTNRKGADCKWSAPTPSQLKRLTAKFGRLGAVNLFCFYRVLC